MKNKNHIITRNSFSRKKFDPLSVKRTVNSFRRSPSLSDSLTALGNISILKNCVNNIFSFASFSKEQILGHPKVVKGLGMSL